MGALAGAAPPPWRRGRVGAPLVAPEAFGAVDFWAETATFWEATRGSTGHGAPRSPMVGKLRQGRASPSRPCDEAMIIVGPTARPFQAGARSWAAAGARVGKLRQGGPPPSPSPPPQNHSRGVLGENNAKSGKIHLVPRGAPHFLLRCGGGGGCSAPTDRFGCTPVLPVLPVKPGRGHQ